MKNLITLIISDAARGDFRPLMGMIDYLVADRNVPLLRLVDIAERRFGIPRHVSASTLQYLC